MNQSRLLSLALAVALGGLTACRSGGADEDAASKPYDPRVWDKGPPEALGAFLAELDKAMRAWTNLTLTAKTASEKMNARNLQEVLMTRVHARQAELQAALESGPPRNRAIAAGALGFSADREMVGPLVVALSDPQSDVVQNAALSLALLSSPDTPTGPLLHVFQTSPNGLARANAGYALRSILEAGAPATEDVIKTARSALLDDEPYARTQAALILAVCRDGDSIEDLGELLRAKEPLVVGAATQALLAMGRKEPKLMGPAARALVLGFGTAEKDLRPAIQQALVVLSGRNHEDDLEAWTEWADRLP